MALQLPWCLMQRINIFIPSCSALSSSSTCLRDDSISRRSNLSKAGSTMGAGGTAGAATWLSSCRLVTNRPASRTTGRRAWHSVRQLGHVFLPLVEANHEAIHWSAAKGLGERRLRLICYVGVEVVGAIGEEANGHSTMVEQLAAD